MKKVHEIFNEWNLSACECPGQTGSAKSRQEGASLICVFFLSVSALVFLEQTQIGSFNSCDPPGMSVCMFVWGWMLLLVHGRYPSLATSDGCMRCECEPGHTRLIYGFTVYVPQFGPRPYGLQSENHRSSQGWTGSGAVRSTAAHGATWES